MTFVAVLACILATALADLRWLRVAQREHYLTGSVSRFGIRWWFGAPVNVAVFLVAAACAAVSAVFPLVALITALLIAVGPLGLSVRGRTAPLVWTRRLKTLAGVTLAFEVVGLLLATIAAASALGAALIALVAPVFIDLALLATVRWERREVKAFVDRASARLRSVDPTVVAITGSYGKTTTKLYVAHFLSGSRSVFATPASFNNRAGLSRAINEQLSPGTQVFVAEMGTYGPGEIAELCDIAPPSIGVITAIGPVHLERFGSETAIVSAKSEIFEKPRVCVLNVDDDRLAHLADKLEADGKKVWRCGSESDRAVVRVRYSTEAADLIEVTNQGERIARSAAPDVAPTNVACAIAVALELGVAASEIQALVPSLPVPQHRQEIARTDQGVTVIDDTFNSNPASVRRGLMLLQKAGSEGHRKVVVTPGMVELGDRQSPENSEFAKLAGAVATDFLAVGRTNRAALVHGARAGGLDPRIFNHLPDAVAWVRAHVSEGDAVLYSNDLPDHYP